MKCLVGQLLLWIAAFSHLTAGAINKTVMEGNGTVTLCVTAELFALSYPEEGKDYHAMNETLMGTGKVCLEIEIIDDNKPEQDESFTVSFSEVKSDIPEGCSHAGSGSAGSGMLISIPDERVITIKDDDKIDDDDIIDDDFAVVIASSVVAGVIGILLALTGITLLCWVAFCYYSKKKKKALQVRNGLGGTYTQFNMMDKSIGDKGHSGSTTTPIHEAIVDIPPSEFGAYVKRLHKDADKGFSLQYAALQAHSPTLLPCKAAQRDRNITKNRYNNILPYDSTRVVLHDKDSDYINASWIDGYRKKKTYVSCQGPLPETVDEFWRMIWELQVPTIVMLTKTVEATKVKCEQYWPSNVQGTVTLNGGLSVLLQEVIPFADYELRKLIISNGSEKRKVTHYYFQAWPDQGVPHYATALLAFIRHVRKCHFPSDPAPLVVHCSAGVGRSGAFIVLDIILQVLEAGANINVYECILKLRAQRCLMVQTEAQYIFIHDALEELITCGKTQISVGDLRIAMNKLSSTLPNTNVTGFQQQFQLLEQVTGQPLQRDLQISQKIYNMGKNRYHHTLPYDFQRVCLRVTGQPGSDYINASWINGYRVPRAFMVTQGPLKNTVNDLWRMVWEMKSRTIVMLCDLQENDEEVCVQYWPEEQKKQSYGNLTVSTKTELMLNDALCTRVFEIYRNGSIAAPVQEVVTVTQFHFHGWSGNELPSDPSLLLDLLDRVLKNQISTGNKPIVVMCSDGSGRSGVFVVLYSQLERLKTEHVVDVFQGIKAARTQRMGIVHNVESYKLIHELLIEYLTQFEEQNYDNFEFPK